MNGLIQDLRYAVRAFARNPGFTAAALVSVAIGVGANSSIFSVASALLLRPLPYQDAERLAILWSRSPDLGIAEDWFSTAQYFDIKTGHRGFEQVAIAIGGNYNLTGDGEPERIGTVRVSSNLLPMLGARPALGRLFTADEDAAGGVVGRVKQYTLDGDSRIAIYLPHTQTILRGINVVLRSRGDPAALAATVRRDIRALDPDLPIYNVRTMTERVDESLARRVFRCCC